MEYTDEVGPLTEEIAVSLLADLNSGDFDRAYAAAEAYSRLTDETDFLCAGEEEAIDMVRDALTLVPETMRAIKAEVVPVIQSLGFTGHYPDFRRQRDGKVETLSFQFDRNGGSFLIEAGKMPLEEVATKYKNVSLDDISSFYMDFNNRHRLGTPYPSQPGLSTSEWIGFRDWATPDNPQSTPASAAKRAVELVRTDAVEWFN